MKTKVVIAILAAGVISAGAYRFFMWNLDRSFQNADWKGLQDVRDSAEAALGAATRAGEPDHSGQGMLAYYQEHPGERERDKRCLQTWRSALEIASYARGREQMTEGWTASTNIQWILPSDRMDGWAHPFCVRSSAQRTVVVSPGWQAIGSLDCATLNIAEEDIAKMEPSMLNMQASGALVFVLPAKQRAGD